MKYFKLFENYRFDQFKDFSYDIKIITDVNFKFEFSFITDNNVKIISTFFIGDLLNNAGQYIDVSFETEDSLKPETNISKIDHTIKITATFFNNLKTYMQDKKIITFTYIPKNGTRDTLFLDWLQNDSYFKNFDFHKEHIVQYWFYLKNKDK